MLPGRPFSTACPSTRRSRGCTKPPRMREAPWCGVRARWLCISCWCCYGRHANTRSCPSPRWRPAGSARSRGAVVVYHCVLAVGAATAGTQTHPCPSPRWRPAGSARSRGGPPPGAAAAQTCWGAANRKRGSRRGGSRCVTMVSMGRMLVASGAGPWAKPIRAPCVTPRCTRAGLMGGCGKEL